MAEKINVIITEKALTDLNEAIAKVKELEQFINKATSPSANNNYTASLKQQALETKNLTDAIIKEEKIKQAKLQTDIKVDQQIKSTISLKEADRKASLAQENQAKKEALANEKLLASQKKLNDAYGQLTQRRNESARALQNSIIETGKSSKETQNLQKKFDALNKSVGQADKAIGKFSQANNGLQKMSSGIGNLMGAFGVVTGVNLFADLVKNIYNTTKELQSLNLALKSVTNTQGEFNAQQIFLKDIAKKHGLEIKSLTKQYTDFYVSAKDKTSGANIQQIFEDIARSGSALGRSNEAMERGFLAVTQMMSKGTVASEELRRQLAEAIPGSVQAMTKAVQILHPEIKNLTEKGLFEMIRKGKILANEVLPETAKQLAIISGADKAEKIDTITKSTNRLKDAWVGFIEFINENDTVIGTFFTGAIEGATLFLKGLQEILSTQYQINLNRQEETFQEGYSQFASSFDINTAKKSQKEKTEYLNQQKKDITAYVDENEKEIERLNKIVNKASWWSPETEVKDLAEQMSRDVGYAKGQLRSLEELLNPIKEQNVTPITKTGGSTGTKRERKQIDFTEYTSAIELRKAELEREKSILEDRMNNEETSLDQRLKLRAEFSKKSIQILDEEMQKEQAVSAKKMKEDLAEVARALKNGDVKTEVEAEKQRIAIRKRTANELGKIDIDYSKKWNDLMDADSDYYKKIQKEKRDLSDETASILLSIEKDKFDKIAKNEELGINYSLKARQKAFDASIALARKELDLEHIKALARSKSDEETARLEATYKKANEAIDNLISPMKEAHEETIKFIESFSDGALEKSLESLGFSSAKMFLDFDVNGKSTFMKLWEGAETTKEKFALAFQAIGDVVQDALSKIGEASDRRYEAEFANLDKQKEIALKNAGDSTAAKEKIEADYEKKKKEVEKRQFKSRQRLALANIAIDTAQAIVGLWVKPGFPAAIPMAITMGALGLIQAGVVASQKPPEYWTGTDNAQEGLALTQERGAEIITDRKGKIKTFGSHKGAVLTRMQSGDKVFNAEESKRMMFENEYRLKATTTNTNNGMTADEMRGIMVETLGGRPTLNMNFDKGGFGSYISKNGNITRQTESRGSGRGIEV